jgi:hypothetical protein
MKPLREVAMSYMALAEAQKKLQDGMYAEAAAESRKAMEISRTMPPEEAFDHEGFEGLCHAALASAEAGLGAYSECLQSAERALRYFSRRGELQQNEGKGWIAVVFSRAVALQETGSPEEAAKGLRIAGEMIAERKGELPGREEMLREIERRLSVLRNVPKPAEKPAYRAWWEFWS